MFGTNWRNSILKEEEHIENYPGEKLKKITEVMQRAVITNPVSDDGKEM